jgi:hypothetical protein
MKYYILLDEKLKEYDAYYGNIPTNEALESHYRNPTPK